MANAQEGQWITVKSRKNRKKTGNLQQYTRGGITVGTLGSSEDGGFDRLGHNDSDVFDDVPESSATYTESSSRTSRSASPSAATASGDKEESMAKAKRKKQKCRKPMATPNQFPVSIDALNAAIVDAQSKYGDGSSSQLGCVTDFFITHYRSSELPFRNILREKPLQKAAEVPLDSVPKEVVERALAFYRGFDVPVLSAFARTLVDAVFRDIPDSAAVDPPKAKVGLLVSVALLLRAVPAVAMLLSDGLLQGNTQYSGPQRLPVLLWTLAQAAIGDVSVGVAVWVRVLLPQVLGSSLAGSTEAAPPKLREESAAAALRFLDLCVAAVQPADEPEQLNLAGYPKWNAGTVALGPEENSLVHGARQGVRWKPRKGKRVVEPVVPPAALDAIVRLSFRSKPVLRAKNNAHLHRHYERLQELALEGVASGGVSVSELVRLSLEAAADGSAVAEPMVLEEGTRTVALCLASASSATATAWQALHVQQLLGSAAVLQSLAASFPPQLNSADARRSLLDLVQELQQKHSAVVASEKGAQQEAVDAADAACEAVKAKLITRTGGAGMSMLAAFALIGSSALAAIALSQTKPFQDYASQSDSGFVRAAMSTLSTVVEQLPPVVLDVAKDAASLAESANERAQPLLHHIHDALDGLYEIVAAYSLQGLHAASVAQQAISARIHGLIAS